MTDHFSAAQSLIVRLNAPPQAHSVWIRSETETDGEGKTRATGKQELCVSIRPTWKNKITVPSEHMGIPVVEVPWPKGS